ncbi:prolyl oligopeptidase family serine peptidase [Streptomyces sp. NBC_01429]|uniref:prolyl oligopeptidase family serine peptidase n=1 Tax=Streptomyces sp. NBC_01429 TaxID=2903862 RepID=UPI002E27F9E6|nr:prolyl oligopeptidase family serine peptidase [Streptomyces sp. NBC_01429]
MELTAFPRQFARTRRFSLGVPQRFTVSPDGERVLFLRSVSGTEPRSLLWLHENGEERVLAGAGECAGECERESAGRGEEASSAGVVSYATDRRARVVAYVLDGALHTVTTDGGAPRRISVPAPVTDPRPSPDGSLIAYVSGGALRVVRTDGTADRPLAEPETPDVTYGLPDHVATVSIGRTRGFWWSPDGGALLVARVDTSMVRRWYVADPADPARPPRAVRYPAAGTANAQTSLRLVTVGGEHTPVALPREAPGSDTPVGVWRDAAFEYLVAADWDHMGPTATVQTRDQRTAWVLGVDPSTGAVEPLSRHTDDAWVEFPPGTPLRTASGVAVLPYVHDDTRSIRIGDVPTPAGLRVRAVLVTDGRGTPGRGVAWQRTIVGDRLTPVLEDQIDALHAAAERNGALDLTRVAIRGWSFSGYLAAGAVLRRPDVFHAAVAGAPPTDRRLYDTYWEERFLGHPDVQPEQYERSSLLPFASGPTRPLLLVHGLADDNVFPAHTLRLSAALLAAGRPHTVLPLRATGHLVAREGTADALLLRELAFLRESLGA